MAQIKKSEPVPNFLKNNQYLLEMYKDRDLELVYVDAKCKALKPLKGIEFTNQQIEHLFMEFVSKGWTKAYFDERYEAIKMVKVFGQFTDLRDWYEGEVLYTAFEANQLVQSTIERKIREAEYMKLQDIKLTAEQEQLCYYAAAQRFLQDCDRERLERRDELIRQFTEENKKKLKTKRVAIMNLSQPFKVELLNKCIDQGVINCSKTGFEFNATVSSLECYADKIPDEMVEEVVEQDRDNSI